MRLRHAAIVATAAVGLLAAGTAVAVPGYEPTGDPREAIGSAQAAVSSAQAALGQAQTALEQAASAAAPTPTPEPTTPSPTPEPTTPSPTVEPTPTTPPPPPRVLVVGASSSKPGTTSKLASMRTFDAALAGAAGTGVPVADFWHVYNGATMPSSWATSNGAQSGPNGWDSMSNIKWASGEIRTTAGRTRFLGFLGSIPADVKVYLVGQHEPENDGLDAAGRLAWRLDQAEFVKLVVDFDPTGEHVVPMSVFMGDPPTSWDEFDFFGLLRPGDVEKMICGWDAYPKARAATATLPERTDDPEFKYGNVADWYRGKGCTRLGIGETTLNNDANVPQALVDQWWQVKLPDWLRANEDVEVVAVYDAAGPAAGTNGYVDTAAELTAVAELMLHGV